MKTKRGFTLVEALLALGLIVVVAGLMYTFFLQGFNLYASETQSADEQASLRLVLSDITNRARLAEPDSIACDDGVLTVGGTQYAYDSTDKRVLRDGSMLTGGIAAFSATLADGLLRVSITSTAGTTLATSIATGGRPS